MSKPPITDSQYRLYPELHLFKEPEQAECARRRAEKQRRCYLALWIVGVITAVALSELLHSSLASTFPSLESPWFRRVITTSVVFSALLSMVYLFRKGVRVRLREALQQEGIAVCLRCGYDLRGQAEARCPECGTAFDASLLDAGTPREEVSPAAAQNET